MKGLVMREYMYTGTARVNVFFSQLVGIIGLLFCLVLAGTLMILPILTKPTVLTDGTIWTFVCLGLWFLVIGGSTCLGLINAYPTIWLDDNGLSLSVLIFGRVFVPWRDVIDIGTGHVPFGNVLVRARRITPLHRIYGWLYSRSLFPSFIIGRDIEGRDELVHEIRQRIRHTR